MAGPGTEERLFRRYAVCADGTRVVQSTAPGLVRAVVESAEVRAGQHVLEVGTGSGYSTAVLAQIVGPAGHVVSLDVNQALAERARDLLGADGLRQVEVHCQDARTELPDGGPFDRVIAWVTSPAVPGAWLAAVRDGSLLVLPVAIAPVLGATAVVRIRRVGGKPHVERLMRGGFAPVRGPTALGLPDLHGLRGRYLVGGRRRELVDDHLAQCGVAAAKLARRARRDAPGWCTPSRPRARLLLAEESPEAFALFVSVTRPEAVVIQAPAIGRVVGVGSWDGLAAQAVEQNVLLTTSEDATVCLREVVQAWRAAGCPDLPAYRPRLRQDGADWLVRLSVS